MRPTTTANIADPLETPRPTEVLQPITAKEYAAWIDRCCRMKVGGQTWKLDRVSLENTGVGLYYMLDFAQGTAVYIQVYPEGVVHFGDADGIYQHITDGSFETAYVARFADKYQAAIAVHARLGVNVWEAVAR